MAPRKNIFNTTLQNVLLLVFSAHISAFNKNSYPLTTLDLIPTSPTEGSVFVFIMKLAGKKRGATKSKETTQFNHGNQRVATLMNLIRPFKIVFKRNPVVEAFLSHQGKRQNGQMGHDSPRLPNRHGRNARSRMSTAVGSNNVFSNIVKFVKNIPPVPPLILHFKDIPLVNFRICRRELG